MFQNGLDEIRRLQHYLGLHHSDARLEHILNKCSIENLQADIRTGKVASFLRDEKGNSLIYRKGTLQLSIALCKHLTKFIIN